MWPRSHDVLINRMFSYRGLWLEDVEYVRKNDLIAASVFLQGVLVVPATLQVLLRSVARDAVWRGDCCGRFHVLDWKWFGREVRGKTHSATFTLKTRRPWVCGKSKRQDRIFWDVYSPNIAGNTFCQTIWFLIQLLRLCRKATGRLLWDI